VECEGVTVTKRQKPKRSLAERIIADLRQSEFKGRDGFSGVWVSAVEIEAVKAVIRKHLKGKR